MVACLDLVGTGTETGPEDLEGAAGAMTDTDHRQGGEARRREGDMTEMIVVEEAEVEVEVAMDEAGRTRDRGRGRRDGRRHTRGRGRDLDRGRDHLRDLGLEGQALVRGRIIGEGIVRLGMGMVEVGVLEMVAEGEQEVAGGGVQAIAVIAAGVEVQLEGEGEEGFRC